jgi:U3 small nucleolar ribonucleoprotein protein IMP4
MITTSRDPSSKLTQFVKELRLVFPNAQRMNRGGHVVKELVEACRAHGVTDLIIAHEHRGHPDGLIVSHMPYGPTVYFGLTNVVTRHDIQTKTTVSEAFPHLVFHNFNTRLGERVKTVLKHLFPVPKPDSVRVMTFANDSDFISFRHHTYKKTGHKDVALEEIGPRFEMRPFQIKLGTVDMDHAENEWALHTFLNTARTRNYL